MADGRKPRKWSLEEIDELLQDSGMLPRDEDSLDMVEEVAPAQRTEAFDPRPSHNKKIKHKIITDTIEKSDSVAEPQVYGNFVSEKYRERFFVSSEKNIEKATDKTIVIPQNDQGAKSGFIKKDDGDFSTGKFAKIEKPLFSDKTRQLEKTAVVDPLQHTKTIGLRSLAVTDGDAHDIELPAEEESIQLSFEGFHEEFSDQVDEREIEEELIRRRKEKASTFTITSEITEPEPDEDTKKYGTDEYRTEDDKFKVSYYLKKRKNTALTAMVVSFACAFILLIISVFSKGTEKGGIIYIILSLMFTAVPVGVGYSFLLDGLKNIKSFRFNRNTGCVLALAAVIIQSAVFITSPSPFATELTLLSGAAIMYFGINLLGEFTEYKRMGENFSYLCEQENIYSVGYIEDEETAAQIGSGLYDEPVILSSRKTLFPRRFIELSGKLHPSDSISNKFVKIGFIASSIVGVITLIISRNIYSSVTAFTASVLVCMPYLSFLSESTALRNVCTQLRNKGILLCGWQGLRLCNKANAVAVDSEDIFNKEGGNVSGIHLFYDMAVDEAIIYASTLSVAAGGPLGNLFKRVVVGDMSILPAADTLTYEDKLGISAWILNRKILLGNDALMRNHNVEIPDSALINKRLAADKYALYLAIDGKAAAVFIISYDADEECSLLLREIEKNNISLLVRANDPNITDIMVAQKLTLPQSGVKVISSVAGKAFKEYSRATTSAADSVLLYNGEKSNFLKAIRYALGLNDIKSILNIIQVCAMGIGLALVACLSFVSGPHHLGCLQIMLVQGIFTAISVLLITFRRFFEKRIGRK